MGENERAARELQQEAEAAMNGLKVPAYFGPAAGKVTEGARVLGKLAALLVAYGVQLDKFTGGDNGQ